MLCPLLVSSKTYVSTQERSEFGECLKGECQWWDSTLRKCAVLSLLITFIQFTALQTKAVEWKSEAKLQ
jgi:hypothetical protein